MITVCDNAKESCPVFLGKVKKTLHLGFIDPAEAKGTKEKILNEFNIDGTKIDKAIDLQQQQITKLKEYKTTLIDSVVTGKVRVA